MADITAVLSALEAFNQPSNRASFAQANSWLQDFQHSNEAWAACNVLLLSPETPLLAKIFAAQTFRAKVTYDLGQLDISFLPSLRDTIITALEQFSGGPKTIVVQLSLALAGLALQFPAWQDVAVQTVIDRFGQNPATVPTLLEFLTVLPEEVNGNTKIPVSNDEYREGASKLLSANAKQVLSLLSLYIAATGVTTVIQNQIFYCLRSWLVAGEVSASDVAEAPLLAFAFQALESDQLFDAAVDVICDLIHETQEIDENMPVIELIVPKLIEIKAKIPTVNDDPEKVRGYARIFSEAGEMYRMLLLQHPETFFPIVEAIGECSAYPDLDVVPITFPFWMRLAQSIGKRQNVSPLFFDAYKSLMNVMIQHLHFPENPSAMSAQEADDFRAFRHVMGDTLKDCCYVLGSENCLSTVYENLKTALARTDTAGHSAVSWQEIEAPLFALRAMGAEIDPSDEQIIPKIMDLLPSLPSHPRVQYAAILVMSRYSEWTARHPSYIPFQLQFISAGFDSTDTEVPAAASQAMNYLCMDCKRHMVPYLPQLHSFLSSVGTKMLQDDRRKIYEAVAHVISAMPMEQAAQSLQSFSVDILSKVHAITTSNTLVTKQEHQDVADGLENLESMLVIIQTFGEHLPAACSNTCQESWTIFEAFITKYGSDPDLIERTARVLRGGLKFFGTSGKPVIPSLISKLSVTFEQTGYASLLWIIGKSVGMFGEENEPLIHAAIKASYVQSTAKVVSLLQTTGIRDIPDVIEDYLRLVLNLLELTPDIFFDPSSFSTAFRITVVSLSLIHSDIIFASLELLRGIVSHDCLDPSSPSTSQKFIVFASVIRQVMDSEGPQLVGNLLAGLVGDFPEETASTVIMIFRMLALLWPEQLLEWLPRVLNQLPVSQAYTPAKKQLLTDVTSAISTGQLDKVKHAIIAFHRFSIKARDRRRVVPIDH